MRPTLIVNNVAFWDGESPALAPPQLEPGKKLKLRAYVVNIGDEIAAIDNPQTHIRTFFSHDPLPMLRPYDKAVLGDTGGNELPESHIAPGEIGGWTNLDFEVGEGEMYVMGYINYYHDGRRYCIGFCRMYDQDLGRQTNQNLRPQTQHQINGKVPIGLQTRCQTIRETYESAFLRMCALFVFTARNLYATNARHELHLSKEPLSQCPRNFALFSPYH